MANHRILIAFNSHEGKLYFFLPNGRVLAEGVGDTDIISVCIYADGNMAAVSRDGLIWTRNLVLAHNSVMPESLAVPWIAMNVKSPSNAPWRQVALGSNGMVVALDTHGSIYRLVRTNTGQATTIYWGAIPSVDALGKHVFFTFISVGSIDSSIWALDKGGNIWRFSHPLNSAKRIMSTTQNSSSLNRSNSSSSGPPVHSM